MDEWAHTYYGLAVIQGEIPTTNRDVDIDQWATSTSSWCWNSDVTVSAACAQEMTQDATQTPAQTTAANYPPLYYALVSWPSLFLAGESAFLAMRLVSAFLFSLLCALGITAFLTAGMESNNRGKRAGITHTLLSLSAICVISPSSYALGGLVNPQSLEISAAVATTGFLLPLVDTVSKRHLYAAAVSVFIWIQARPVGPLWAIFLCALLIGFLGFKRSVYLLRLRAFWVFLASAITSSILWLLWRSIAPIDLADAPACGLSCSFFHVISSNDLEHITATTGDLNVSAPPFLLYPYYGFLLGLFFLAFVILKGRARKTIIIGVILIPIAAFLIQFISGEKGGAMWQGRYALPFEISLALCVLYFLYLHSSLNVSHIRRIGFFGILSFTAASLGLVFWSVLRFYLGNNTVLLAHEGIGVLPLRAHIGMLGSGASCFVLAACSSIVTFSLTGKEK